MVNKIYKVTPEIMRELNEKMWMVDIVFITKGTLEEAEALGFDGRRWIEKNGQRVYYEDRYGNRFEVEIFLGEY